MAPKQKINEKKTGLEEMAIETTAENEAIDQIDIQNEVDNVDVLRSVLLEIDNQDVTEQILSTHTFTKKQGTPQERMLFLFEQIKNFTKKNITNLDDIINELKKMGRKDLTKIKDYYPESIVNTYISSIKKGYQDSMNQIILTWIPIFD